MDNYTDERDLKCLEKDKYTFFVLGRILGAECELKLSDHEKTIICFTNKPFPVWIWTKDGMTDDEMEEVYRTCKENGLMDGSHSFNIKYELAEYFIKRAEADGLALSVSMNMFAYDCLSPIEPVTKASGTLHLCTEEDLDELTEFLYLFHEDVGIDKKDMEGYRKDAESHIASGRMYFWKDDNGRNVASCKFDPNGEMASINLVYTRHESRRKHYAENIVYQVTKLAMDAGYVPMLYTNADYVASNACYEKVGYVLRGKLCTVG
ncbi:MAG: GNAT family N-acetyltransferase [Lachnospiraceae bacterium]|nr:GNAT family N-acetyltransferase [Lachnospiraceae bacterium]